MINHAYIALDDRKRKANAKAERYAFLYFRERPFQKSLF